MDFKKQSNIYLEDLYNLLYDLPLEERPKKVLTQEIEYYNLISSDDFVEEIANEMLKSEKQFLNTLTKQVEIIDIPVIYDRFMDGNYETIYAEKEKPSKIDNHYSILDYEPIDFINKFNLNFTSGNYVKLISRHNTTNRADLNNGAKLERIRFYLEQSIRNIDKKFFEPCGLHMELKRYILANNFTENQSMYLEMYFDAILNKDSLQLKIMLDNLNKFL